MSAIAEAIRALVAGQDLRAAEAAAAMEDIMDGRATPAQIAGFLVALRMKGETVDEVAGCAEAMRRRATPVPLPCPDAVDTCGTGGDGQHTFNVSTAAALVVAAAGVPVAKHGNRAVSGRCGSADVLEALGVVVDLDPPALARCLERVGLAFLFAPRLHGAMRHALGPRRELGVRTVFNLLGPLTNPAGVRVQLTGVYDPRLVRPVAEVLGRLGARRALVVHGQPGLDEVSPCGETLAAEWDGRDVRLLRIRPEDAGLEPVPVEAIRGGDPDASARILRAVLAGEPGPYRTATLLNAAAALYVAGRVEDLREGVALAAAAIDSGAALERLEALVAFTQREATRRQEVAGA